MSDREDEPTDLFDAICRLDDLIDWLLDETYVLEADRLRDVSQALKAYIVITARPDATEPL